MNEVKDYIDLKVEEAKLKATQGLSIGLGRIASMFLILSVLGIVLTLLAVAAIAWLAEALDSFAIAGTITFGVFLVLLIVLYCLRKKLFRHTIVWNLTDDPTIVTYADVTAAQKDVKRQLQRNSMSQSGFYTKCGKLLLNLLIFSFRKFF